MKPADVAEQLSEVIDPELGIDVVSLGLLYGIELDDEHLRLEMTLTTPDCPMGEVLGGMIAAKLRRLAGHRRVEIEVVDDPHWNIAMIAGPTRERLGLPAA